MKTIWKFAVDLVDRPLVSAPTGWRPLSVGVQDGVTVIWAEVDPDRMRVVHELMCVGTGHPWDGAGKRRFIGTVQRADGLVFHYYEVIA